jgi:CRISPR-associated endonuclease/helicase Cas3
MQIISRVNLGCFEVNNSVSIDYMTKPDFVAHTPSDDRTDNEWHGLKEHLEAVAMATEASARKLNADKLAYYAGLWHDLGKYNPKFQAFLQKAHTAKLSGQKPPGEKVPHAIYGAILAYDLNCTPSAKLGLSFLIAGHHAGLPNQVDLKSRLNTPKTRIEYKGIYQQALAEFGTLKPKEDLDKHLRQFGSDRMAGELFFRLVFSCLIDADRLDSERFGNPKQYRLRQERSNAVTIEQLWDVFDRKQEEFVKGSKEPESKVNQIRAEVYQKCIEKATSKPGVFRLCVPTGGGKTRSGLAFALKHAKEHGKDRVIFAVPYTSIIEQTVKVYRENIFKELGDVAVLEHHSATQAEKKLSAEEQEQLETDENAQVSQAQAKLATQNWDAKLIVTTTVQLFDSLLSHKTKKCRKLHNIVNSVIVLDEVQTLPIGLLSPILSVLKELVNRYHVTVVLCTATQPALEGNTPYFRDAFPEDSVQDILPKKLAIEHFQTLKRVNYEIPQKGETWTWAQLTQDMAATSSSLVVLNTRRDAIAVLNELGVDNGYSGASIEPRVLESLKKSAILHLSTLLCGKHRQAVLEEVRRRLDFGEPCRLISTQVVEAGVDVDFPVVYRAMGPLDRIVQAAGRCNRNGKLKNADKQLIQGRVVIFEPVEGSKPPSGEYSKAIQKAREFLQANDFMESQLHEPDIFDRYFQDLYSMIDSDQKIKLNGGETTIQELRKSWSFRDVGENFKLIKDDTTPIVIQYDEAVRSRLDNIARRGIWSEDHSFLQPYTINLPTRLFNKLNYKEEVKPGTDLWKWTSNYDPIRGFPLEQLDQEVLIDPLFLMM